LVSGTVAVRGRVFSATLAVLLMLGLAAAGGCFWLQREFQAPGPAAALTRIDVVPGASVRGVLTQLQTMGAVRNCRAVIWYLRLRGAHPRMQAGVYEIPPRASPAEIIALFEEGKVVLDEITVVEGATFGEFLEALDQHPHVTHTLKGKTPGQIMSALGHAGVSAEGEFFPDTYRFAANTTDAVILDLAYQGMQRTLAAAWAARATDLPFDSPYQGLILASMVEKEAALKSERALIAGVFVNRLRKGMRLQSDPTVIYGVGEKYDGYVHTRDLTTDTAYNTYTREGLPPTPIALPGRESVIAAVHPAATAAVYFVATGLGDGAHHFSRTLEEHNAAVQTYLARLRHPQHNSPPAGAQP
jgi:peptidoglycan lytic transglycosylase G